MIDQVQTPPMREDLIDAVCDGVLTPAEARAEADRLGLRPLDEQENRSDHDPHTRLRWTWPMAVAWIAWRRADQVREVDEAWRSTTSVWASATLAGAKARWFLKPVEPVSDLTLQTMAAIDRPPVSLAAAHRLLVEQLAAEELVASGLPVSGRLEPIPALVWSADPDFNDDFSMRADGFKYEAVYLQPLAVIELWPSAASDVDPELPAATPLPARRSKASPQLALAKTALMAAFGDVIPPPSSMSDADLYSQAARHAGAKPPSKDTVLRAAGRRK